VEVKYLEDGERKVETTNVQGGEDMNDQKLLIVAKNVFYWYYIFGEDNIRARELLANLGNALRESGYINKLDEKYQQIKP
jgi:hypothetical protein